MGAGTLTIYSASAGSGKTYNLAGAYLQKLFTSRYSYRKILAVTFTHKATTEMKSRILEELNNLAAGDESKYLDELIGRTGKNEEVIRREAKEILYMILHDFSRFSVSTIDSFFQKILRAFARDIGLHAGFNIELDHTLILSSAVDKMIASAAADPSIKKWLSEYVRANIESEKSWDIRKNIIDLADEIFSEKFRLLSLEEREKLQNKEFLSAYIRELRAISHIFEKELERMSKACLEYFSRFNLQDELFYYKGRGVPGFIRSLAGRQIKSPNSYVRMVEDNPPRWSSGTLSPDLAAALRSGFGDSVIEIIHYFDNNILNYNSANAVLANVYSLGILSDVLNQIRLIASDENIFLLSDTGELIYLITEKDQTPFIYEKVGNSFENYMIDEFQDTSIIQWKNFSKLIENSMAQGFDNLVVGDIKQSIYRWRNSTWQTLRDLKRGVDNKRFISQPLDTNWRSSPGVIRFNNELFSIIPFQLDREFSDANVYSGFSELFSEAVQHDPGKKEDGYVKIEFIEASDDKSWQKKVLDLLPGVLESILDKGYNPSDIGILVRDNKEGSLVLKRILAYSSLLPPERKSMLRIVSNDSLLLVNAPVINFIISVLMVLDNPGNLIGRAMMLRYYNLATGARETDSISLDSDAFIEVSTGSFPGGYVKFLEDIRYFPLWDITEKTISFFGLGEYSFNVAYLNSFQDIILSFASGKNPGIPAFLEWWESEGPKKSISLPEQQDAIRVLTIHKSKGLEFGVVILPFLAWNLDHKSFHTNILWVKPVSAPFNALGIVPVRYKSDLSDTIFAGDYFEEKYSAYADNINLLYVALTRAVTGIFGFAPANTSSDNRIAQVIWQAINFRGTLSNGREAWLFSYFDAETMIFEFGVLPASLPYRHIPESANIQGYPVSTDIGSLKLKLHWERYLNFDGKETARKINYGNTMHEIFEEIISFDDIDDAVRQKVLEGKLPLEEEASTRERIAAKINQPETREWFDRKNDVLIESSILLPGSGSKRPDRIILREGRTIIVDFKFGDEDPRYLSQIRSYKRLLGEMGYDNVEAYLWYFDFNKIVCA